MALQVVNVRPVPGIFSTFQLTSLDDVQYRLAFYYNKPGDFWTMNIANAAGVDLVVGIKLALGIDLLEPYKYIDGMPQGQLFVYDTSRADDEPGEDGFDGRCLLLYRPADEVAA